jgi:hypothetical protein
MREVRNPNRLRRQFQSWSTSTADSVPRAYLERVCMMRGLEPSTIYAIQNVLTTTYPMLGIPIPNTTHKTSHITAKPGIVLDSPSTSTYWPHFSRSFPLVLSHNRHIAWSPIHIPRYVLLFALVVRFDLSQNIPADQRSLEVLSRRELSKLTWHKRLCAEHSPSAAALCCSCLLWKAVVTVPDSTFARRNACR